MTDVSAPLCRFTLRRLLLVGGAALVIPWLATFVTAVLAVSEMARTSAADRVHVVGEDLLRNLDATLRLGVPVGQVTGIDKVLQAALAADDDILSVRVTAADGSLLGDSRRPPESGRPGAFIDSRTISLARDGATAATVTLTYAADTTGDLLGDLAGRLAALLLALLTIGAEVVLVAYRETVLVPLRAIALQERLATKRSFAHLAAGPADSPLHPLVEAANRLFAALNDRFAGLRDYLAEVKTMTFHAEAAAAAARLEAELAAVGRLAPDGMNELPILAGDLFAGPMLFRAGLFLGLLASAAGGPAEGMPPTVPLAGAVLAGLPLAFLRRADGLRRRLVTGTAAAALGMLLLLWLPGSGLRPAVTALTAAAILSLALAVPGSIRGAAAVIGRLSHAAAGLTAGGCVAATICGPTMAAIHAALALTFASIVTMAVRHGEHPPGGDWTLSRAGLPTLGFAVAAGIWLTLRGPATSEIGGWPGGIFLVAGLLAAAAAQPRLGSGDTGGTAGGIALAALVLILTAWLSTPFDGAGLGLTGLGLGFGAGCAILFGNGAGAPLADIAIGLGGGAVLAIAGGDAQPGLHRLFLALAAAAAVLPALPALWTAARRVAREGT